MNEITHACSVHVQYHLSCAQYIGIKLRSGGLCETCGRPSTMYWPLVIDHDHRVGHRAVRGLVCVSCNKHLSNIDAGARPPNQAEAAYLAKPWYRIAGVDGRCPHNCKSETHRAILANIAPPPIPKICLRPLAPDAFEDWLDKGKWIVVADVLDHFLAGLLVPGGRLPYLAALAARYGVAERTVGHAARILREWNVLAPHTAGNGLVIR